MKKVELSMAETDDHTLWLGTANYGICKVINEIELQTRTRY